MGRVRGLVAMHLAGDDDAQRGCASMVRICTGDVWVRMSRRSRSGFALLAGDDELSWVSRAGWLGGKFSDSKL